MDIATIIGITLALGSILGGQVLEGGHVGSIMQLTAFIIVMVPLLSCFGSLIPRLNKDTPLSTTDRGF